MKERAQRCFVSYLRSVYLMKNKEVFDVFKIPLVEYAQSLGLAVPPRVRFLQNVKASENKPTEVLEPGNASDEEIENFKAQLSGKNLSKMDKRNIKSDEQSSGDEEEEEGEDSEEEKLQKNNKPSGFQLLDGDDDDEDEGRDEEIFTVKRRDIFGINEDKKEVVKEEITKTKLKKMEKVSKVKEAKN
ncbi:hypothetical protein GDO81_023295 [Engystomops pustulosus]|uniref:ATP-dependent rRNA helicase SPB4-like C-terminal extension domain-containing protein n=1 Tax=Engystomops pustulosus TaxID=76066 RepID=A0AAV6Z316_ENGPU|nr:hypothetical protein GDO81_023295 [Engystomops pustulosus]